MTCNVEHMYFSLDICSFCNDCIARDQKVISKVISYCAYLKDEYKLFQYDVGPWYETEQEWQYDCYCLIKELFHEKCYKRIFSAIVSRVKERY